MGSYITLSMRTEVFNEIIDDLMLYVTQLKDYYDIESCIHLIDFLHEEYEHDMNKQNREYMNWQKYEKLFQERFENGEFCDDEGGINEKGMYEYKNFNKINKVLEDFKYGGTLDIMDTEQQFFLVLDLINVMRDEEC